MIVALLLLNLALLVVTGYLFIVVRRRHQLTAEELDARTDSIGELLVQARQLSGRFVADLDRREAAIAALLARSDREVAVLRREVERAERLHQLLEAARQQAGGSGAGRARYERVAELLDRGVPVEEICARMELSQVEVEMVAGLRRRAVRPSR